MTVNAEDSFSGISSIEYMIDGGKWNVYEDEVFISEPGTHEFYARAFDKSGKCSAVKKCLVDCGMRCEDEVIDYVRKDDEFRVEKNLSNGKSFAYYDSASSVVSDLHCHEYVLSRLPEYLSGTEYIKWNLREPRSDVKTHVSEFYLMQDSFVFMATENDMRNDGWSLVERNASLGDSIVLRKINVYVKKNSAGGKICIEHSEKEKLLVAVRKVKDLSCVFAIGRNAFASGLHLVKSKSMLGGDVVCLHVVHGRKTFFDSVFFRKRFYVEYDGIKREIFGNEFSFARKNEDMHYEFSYEISDASGRPYFDGKISMDVAGANHAFDFADFDFF